MRAKEKRNLHTHIRCAIAGGFPFARKKRERNSALERRSLMYAIRGCTRGLVVARACATMRRARCGCLHLLGKLDAFFLSSAFEGEWSGDSGKVVMSGEQKCGENRFH